MTMRLNTIKPAPGAKSARKRVARGRGSGRGGTSGRGTKGQKSRSGGYHKVGFEGGQMPLQRRLPKRGFRSMAGRHSAELRLHELGKVEGDVVDLEALQKAGVIGRHITRAKVVLSGRITRAVTVRGISATAGARRAIEAAGGTVEMDEKPSTKQAAKSKGCLCCQKKMPTEMPRICPVCQHVFQGNGWDGIDAHWRARHEDVMPYEKFWETLCDEHGGGSD